MDVINKNADVPMEQKLKNLYDLQQVQTEINKIKNLRGELPLEVQDLEDELAGLETRIATLKADVKTAEQKITEEKHKIIQCQEDIKKYQSQQDNVRNNREYDSLTKEIEFQSLEIELCEKHIREFTAEVEQMKEKIEASESKYNERHSDLEQKKGELDSIIAETQKKEEELIAKEQEIASLQQTISNMNSKVSNLQGKLDKISGILGSDNNQQQEKEQQIDTDLVAEELFKKAYPIMDELMYSDSLNFEMFQPSDSFEKDNILYKKTNVLYADIVSEYSEIFTGSLLNDVLERRFAEKDGYLYTSVAGSSGWDTEFVSLSKENQQVNEIQYTINYLVNGEFNNSCKMTIRKDGDYYKISDTDYFKVHNY